MPSTPKDEDSSDRYCLVCTSNSTSSPISIKYPDQGPEKPWPRVLWDDDAAGRAGQLPKSDITDYTNVHYPKMPKPSEARFEKTTPTRLGQRAPPGSIPKPPPRKDLGLQIVPDYVPVCENVREWNQQAWNMLQVTEKVERRRKAAQRRMAQEIRMNAQIQIEESESWIGSDPATLISLARNAPSNGR